jgi:hypothetical protein
MSDTTNTRSTMTTAAPRLAGFAIALVVLFGVGALAGGVIDPAPPKAAKASAQGTQGGAMGAMADPHAGEKSGHAAMTMGVRGLGLEQNGLRLVVETSVFKRGRAATLRYRVVKMNGAVLRDYDVEHSKRMHLIVVRRDLTGFQHLHPKQDASGAWVTPLRLDEAGSYRVFADFSHDQKPTTLAADVAVDGGYVRQSLPAPAGSADADGFRVSLREPNTVAGREAHLRFQITRNGQPVQVEPYLGADGHLVALREGDLAFLHVHPTKLGEKRPISFDATFPTTGRYRLFLQFKVAGKVHTAAFTQVAR